MKISQNSQENKCVSLFFNKNAGLLEKRLRHRCFPVRFAKISRTPFFKEPLVATSEYRQKRIDKTNLTFTVPSAPP